MKRIHNSQFTIHNSQFTIHNYPPRGLFLLADRELLANNSLVQKSVNIIILAKISQKKAPRLLVAPSIFRFDLISQQVILA